MYIQKLVTDINICSALEFTSQTKIKNGIKIFTKKNNFMELYFVDNEVNGKLDTNRIFQTFLSPKTMVEFFAQDIQV